MNNFELDYTQALYNLNNRIEREQNKIKNCSYEENMKIYQEEKEYMIKLFENDSDSDNEDQNINNKCWNYQLWDICFASSYHFPNNQMGFRGQWYLPKLKPFVRYLTGIARIENIHMCYKKINETDCLTLENLFNYVKQIECNCIYNQKRCDWCDYLEGEMYRKDKINKENIISKITWNEYNNFVFTDFEYKFNCIDDVNNFRINKLQLIKDEEKDDVINILNLLEKHFLSKYSFHTLYLPENITKFEDFIVIQDGGNCCEIIAKSNEYFYYFQQTN